MDTLTQFFTRLSCTKFNVYQRLGMDKGTFDESKNLNGYMFALEEYFFCFCVGRPHALTKLMHPDACEWVRCPFLDLDAERHAYYVCHDRKTFYVMFTRNARETIEDLLTKK